MNSHIKKNMTQSECFAESGWSTPRFWQREKIRVCKLNDSLQVQFITQNVVQQLLQKFSSLLKTGSPWTFFIISSGPSLEGNVSLRQQEEIQTVLAANKPISQIKQEIIEKVQEIGEAGQTKKVNFARLKSPKGPESPVCPVLPTIPPVMKRSKLPQPEKLSPQAAAYAKKTRDL